MLKAAGLREQTAEEIQELGRATARHLMELRTHKGTSDASESPIRKRTLRRELARIKTVMRERGIREHG